MYVVLTETKRQLKYDVIGSGSKVTVTGAEERLSSEGLRVVRTEDSVRCDGIWKKSLVIIANIYCAFMYAQCGVKCVNMHHVVDSSQ